MEHHFRRRKLRQYQPALPFSMQYGGGYSKAWNGPPSAGSVYQHLSLSQGKVWRAWNLMASENVSYSFETPTTGFSGVPGSGEPIGEPGPSPLPDQTVLTQNTRTLDNFTTLTIAHRLDFATSLNVSGSWGQMRFIDNNGQNSDTLTANAGITRRLNARNSISGEYSFSRFTTAGAILTVGNRPIQLQPGQQRAIGLQPPMESEISSIVSVGPQWVSSSDSAIVPSSTSFSMSASAVDTLKFGSANLSYFHGAAGGSGYMLGGKIDVITQFFRGIWQELECRSDGFVYAYWPPRTVSGITNAKYGGMQATRQLGRYLNTFANYTAMDQSSNGYDWGECAQRAVSGDQFRHRILAAGNTLQK